MAIMNLLKANFTGSVGRVTGANWKGKAVVKSRIFSKAPPSNAQTQSVRAFEALNRLSAVIAKQGFPCLGLPSKNLLPHNAVAKFLKPLISNHTFDIANASKVIPQDGCQTILAFTHNKSTEIGTLKISLGTNYVPTAGTKTFINVFNQFGYSFFSDFINTSNYSKSFFMPYSPEYAYNVLIFMSEPANKGVLLHGLDYKKRAGMQFSTDEQLTGDLWLDGKPIYVTTVNVPSHVVGTWSYLHGIANIDKILKYDAYYLNTGGGAIPCNNPWPDQMGAIEIYRNRISFRQLLDGPAWTATVTIFYTKTV